MTKPICFLLTAFIAFTYAQDIVSRRAARVRIGLLQPPPSPLLQVEGKVLDGNTGEPLAGALIVSKKGGVYADSRGSFALQFAEPETLTITFPEYKTLRVYVAKPQTGMVFRLFPQEAMELEPVIITAVAERESEAGAFIERLRSLEIGEIYTQELISQRSADFYLPNALRRLPGISLLTGRYLSIRGLGERYNALAFGNAYLTPLSYDASLMEVQHLITSLAGYVEVRKFWTPDLPSHFGGGIVNIHLPQGGKERLQVAFTSEVDAGAAGRRFPRFPQPWTDAVPQNFPSPAQIQASENNGRPLPENFVYGQQLRRYTIADSLPWAPPGGLLTMAYNLRSEKAWLSLRGALARQFLSSSFRFRYVRFSETEKGWTPVEYLETPDRNPLYFSLLGGGAAVSAGWQLTPAHTLQIDGIFYSVSDQRITQESGRYINPNIDTLNPVEYIYPAYLLRRNTLGLIRPSWHYQAGPWRVAVQNGLLLQRFSIPQTGAMNYVQYPGASTYTYEQELYDEAEIYAQVWTSRSVAQQVYVHPYVERRWQWGGERWLMPRIGLWYAIEQQTTNARQVGFMPDTAGGAPFVLPAEVYDIDHVREVYSPSYIRPGGWYLIDRTGDYHRHWGDTRTYAAYGWIRGGVGLRWEALLGARYEIWQRNLYYTPIATEQKTLLHAYREASFLPSLLFKYRLSERAQLRMGGSITALRPPMVTQIPMPYFDFWHGLYWRGDTSVRSGYSYNAEARYEWLRDKSRRLSIGVFYKRLIRFPEVYLVPESYYLTFTFALRTRPWGEVAGIELEAQEVLHETERARLWTYLTLMFSESAAERSFLGKLGRSEGHRLQSHSPIVSNAGLIYTRRRYELSAFLNYTGAATWAIGFDPYIFPHYIEHGRLTIEGQGSVFLGQHWEVRLAVWDFLNQPFLHSQRVGNAERYLPDRDAIVYRERWAYRFYVTVRYRL